MRRYASRTNAREPPSPRGSTHNTTRRPNELAKKVQLPGRKYVAPRTYNEPSNAPGMELIPPITTVEKVLRLSSGAKTAVPSPFW